MQSLELKGVIPAVLTPYDADHHIDTQALKAYVDFLINHGVHGLFAAGTNGEGMLLSAKEKKTLIETITKQAAGRIPVIAHTGAMNSEETLELTRFAQEVGASGAAIVTPWYFAHDEESLYRHYGLAAQACPDFPIFIYNLPGNAKNDMKPGLVKRLRENFANIIGIKDSSKDLNRLCEYINLMGKDFTVIVGTDSLVVPALLMGAVGVVSAVADVYPEVMIKMYNAFVSGNLEEAVRLQYVVINLRDALKTGPYVTPYKVALQMRGVNVSGYKPPFRWPDEKELASMRAKLEKLGVVG
ncbi:MAG: 4-hydroxy-tetrahydrodipicolinate synthase [Desulfitobacteriaceae bacterium]|nr:4-hydroxy-tetrahydrodipicolinate synthase [Desulfitobacteriaceae bacterium]MDI6877867.1 4-hydroxy-tetrahydrodipicolinate synthase [Desulfitobacteriaceae bacterium]MDI6912732.1 4-hydroxy-tetrahydrodipicolinate synthase [Desulfitobacteriaceae bacterium]